MDYSKYFSKNTTAPATTTPQTQPLTPNQVKNSAGGYGYQVSDQQRLDRFLILGSEGGSYYATEKNLTLDNAKVVGEALTQDGPAVVQRIIEISDAGRAVRNDAAIFALAMALKFNDGSENSVQTRRAAAEAVPTVCRTFYHITQLAEFIKPFGGWGRVTQRAFDNWYTTKSDADIAYQMLKYQQRNGWTHRDLLLKAHVKPESEVRDTLYAWAAQGTPIPEGAGDPLDRVYAAEEAKKSDDVKRVISLIEKYNLPREVVPTEFLNDVEVWETLLERMPMTAMIRNLGKMTSLGLLTNTSDATRKVVSRLQDVDYLRNARVHPMTLLNALRIYTKGAGFRGSLSWSPAGKVTDALDEAFYKAFDFVEPTGKNICLALDISGSMGWSSCAGLEGLTPREVSAAMAMTVMRTEENYEIMAFSHKFVPLSLSPRQRLDDVIKAVSNKPFGSTDCAIPMMWAKNNYRDFDAFAIYTDSETYYGNIHPKAALDQYRNAQKPEARVAVVACVSSRNTIADPQDPGMLDIVGVDTSVPKLLTEFISGNV